LDRDTSGCLLVAKTRRALDFLQRSFKERSVDKTYVAVVVGEVTGKGVLTDYIGRHPVNRKKMAVLDEGGKRAVTRYETLSTGSVRGIPLSLLKIDIETGRTHQIRVQMSSFGHPVAGDATYGGSRIVEAGRQLLHARRITFPHPKDSKRMTLEAPPPSDIRCFLDDCFPPDASALV
jgi:23S rRNA pseudouridine1911/1915/1917 synthase